jgi:perosamine synthetase
MNKKISWWQPQIGASEYELVKKVLDSGYLNEGELATQFENELARLLNCPSVIAVTSGTAALYLSLVALGIGHGDEVIVPDLTFIATANAVTMCGAKPILVDIEKDTLNMSVYSFAKAISSKTRAVIPVHVSGRAADLAQIKKLADKHNIHLIEDAAEALMSHSAGQALGTIGKLGCFSFSPNKTITTGQGGAIACHNPDLAIHLRQLKDQGRPQRGTGGDDLHPAVGFNFKFTNLQAAVGLGQLQHLESRLKRMKEIYLFYKQELSSVPGINLLPFSVAGGESPQWIDALVENRDGLDSFLQAKNIHCRRFWHPIHTQVPYKRQDADFPVSTKAAKKAIWLPSDFTLSDEDLMVVCQSIKEFASTVQLGQKI